MDIAVCLLHPQNKPAFYCYECGKHLCSLCAQALSHALISLQDYQAIVDLFQSKEEIEKQQYDMAANLLPSTCNAELKTQILTSISLHSLASGMKLGKPNIGQGIPPNKIDNSHSTSCLSHEIMMLKKQIEAMKKNMADMSSYIEERTIIKYENNVLEKINEIDYQQKLLGAIHRAECDRQHAINHRLLSDSEKMKHKIKLLSYDNITEKITKATLWLMCRTDGINSKTILNELKMQTNHYINKFADLLCDYNAIERIGSDLIGQFYIRAMESSIINIVDNFSSSLTTNLLIKNAELLNDEISSNSIIYKFNTLLQSEHHVLPIPQQVQNSIILNFKDNFYERIIKYLNINVVEIKAASLTKTLINKENDLISNLETTPNRVIDKLNELIISEHNIIPIPQHIQSEIRNNFKAHYYERICNIIASSLTVALINKEMVIISNAETSSSMILEKYKQFVNEYAAANHELPMGEKVKEVIVNQFRTNFYEKVLSFEPLHIADIIATYLIISMINKESALLLNSETPLHIIISKFNAYLNKYANDHNELLMKKNIKNEICKNFKITFYEKAFQSYSSKMLDIISHSLTFMLIKKHTSPISNAETQTNTIISLFNEILIEYANTHNELHMNNKVKTMIMSNFKANFYERAMQCNTIDMADIISSMLTNELLKREQTLISNAETASYAIIAQYRLLFNEYSKAHNELPITEHTKILIINKFKSNFYEKALQYKAIDIADIIASFITKTLITKEKNMILSANTTAYDINAKMIDMMNDYATAHKDFTFSKLLEISIINRFKLNYNEKASDIIASSLTTILINKENTLISNAGTLPKAIIEKFNNVLNDYAESHTQFSMAKETRQIIINNFIINFYDRALQSDAINIADAIATYLTNVLINKEKAVISNAETSSTVIISKFKEVVNAYSITHNEFPITEKAKNAIILNFKDNFYERAFQSNAISMVDSIALSLTNTLIKKENVLLSNAETSTTIIISKFKEVISEFIATRKEFPITDKVKEGIINNFKANFFEWASDKISYSLTVWLIKREKVPLFNGAFSQNAIITKYKELIIAYATAHGAFSITDIIKEKIVSAFKNNFYTIALKYKDDMINIVASSLTTMLINKEATLSFNTETLSNIVFKKILDLINTYIIEHKQFSINESIKNSILNNCAHNFYDRVLQCNNKTLINKISAAFIILFINKEKALISNADTSSNVIITKFQSLFNEYTSMNSQMPITTEVANYIINNFKINFYEIALKCSIVNIAFTIASSLTTLLFIKEKALVSNCNATPIGIISKFNDLLNEYALTRKEITITEIVKCAIINNFKKYFYERAIACEAINISDIIELLLNKWIANKEIDVLVNAESSSNIIITYFNTAVEDYFKAHNDFLITEKLKSHIFEDFKANFYKRISQCQDINIADIIASSLTVVLIRNEKEFTFIAEAPCNTIIPKFEQLIKDYATAHNGFAIPDKLSQSILNNFKLNYFERLIHFSAVNSVENIASMLTIALIKKEKALLSNTVTPILTKFKTLLDEYAAYYKELPITDKIRESIISSFKANFYERVFHCDTINMMDSIIIAALNRQTPSREMIIKMTKYLNEYLASNSDIPMLDKLKEAIENNIKLTTFEIADKLSNNGYTVFRYSYISKICEWVGKSCSFYLLFRASRDGYLIKDFHRACDNKGPTIIIMKNNFNKIIGGYTPLPWSNPYFGIYKADDSLQSFLFSLSTGKKYEIHPNEDQKAKAIYCSWNYGVYFGNETLSHHSNDCREPNSCIANIENNDCYNKESYSLFVGGSNQYFSIIDYEVFEVHLG